MPLYSKDNSGLLFTNKSGAYIQPGFSVSTSVTLGNGNLRVVALQLARPITISAIGTEFTVAGDAASLFRMTVFADDGTGYPGSLLLDGGSISTGSGNAGTVATGGTPGVYMNTGIAATTLPAGLVWLGGAVQGVTSTQPTMRTGIWNTAFLIATNSVPTANQFTTSYLQGSVTGAPPSSFTAFAATSSGTAPARITLKIQ